ncbi:UDP-glucose 4-epimerase GalE [Kushneria phosphatilytica]|uniref:UDP-glucose 4-epimerase n=1 Tax=Kushneria phosphatilytica TaxID=657387 RepID=A0A1S1P0I7_9GAMM|nr:UDP-glucose 4-epimerase GalE [Kushneria phosphatilytica]OHV11995.1 UDP-glucose 4-epimerase GalE [Kushneria phosphatilytica]QEL11182.1 UDP-glucose 4-epimerase GalE [Kushneria phosphatilytica]
MILVTGGAGYIGSHTVLALLQAGHEVVVLDSLTNSSPLALERVATLAGREVPLVEGDIRNEALLDSLFERYDISAVVHFAGLKAVGESVEKPLAYFDNNVNGTLVLCRAMARAGVKSIVFSSSATVYGDPETVPIQESFPTSATNPYGRSKLMVEEILRDLCQADDEWRVALLRYFNPVGAHESGMIGEDPHGIPNNLVPFISQVAIGRRETLSVFGNDYDTPDGTGVRDYIHVVDLADGHLKALDFLAQHQGVHTFNLGTGKGYSVLEVTNAFARVSGRDIPHEIKPRRPGDIACCYADPAYAESMLGWRAQYGIERMMADTWRWQQQNPQGYEQQ